MFPRSQPFSLSSSGDAHAGDFEDISTRTLQSVRVGQSAGKISSGSGNAFVGFEAGKTNVQGSYNAMVGYQAGAQNANASYTTMVGAYAGAQNQRGSEVTFVGFRAGEMSRDGNQLVGVGAYALRENVSGNGTVAIGYRSAERTLDGYFNTMIGTESGQDNRSGNFNTMAGYRSGRAAFLGNENTYLGAFSGYSNRRGSGNSFVGYRAGEELQNGDFNVAIGAYSMQYASSGSSNIAIGPFAGAQVSQNASENVLIGTQVSADGSPNRSVVLGALAGATMSGDGSVLIGYQAGYGLEVGNCNILIGTGATSYSPSNNFGIAIGSFRTQTYTNSLSIGNDVTNQREFSILVGNDVSTDADNSIIVGKTNTIESFVVWKDPISSSLRQAVLNDGQTKLGLCNIDYSDTVISPCNEIYATAIAKIFASNIESSLTNPPHGREGPVTYDLRQYVPEHMIHAGIVLVARNSNEYQLSNESLLFFTSNAFISSSTQVVTSPTTITMQELQHNTSTSADAYLLQHTVDSNIAVNIRSLSNLSTSIPIQCVLRHCEPILQTNTVTTSLNVAPTSQMHTAISLPNITIDTTCNLDDGVFLHTVCNELRYTVDVAPEYGSLNKSIYTSLDDITYTPYPEHAMATSDSFQLRPHYILRDDDLEYGIRSQTTSTIQIEFAPNPELLVANAAILSNETFILDSNVLLRIPPISSNTYVNVMYMPPNYVLHTPYRATPYTSNDIQRIVLCNVYDYPPEAYDSYLDTIDTRFSNVLALHQPYASNVSTKLYDIVDFSSQLLGQVGTQAEIDTIADISAIAQGILDLNYEPTQLTSNATIYLLSKVDEWRTLYDPSPYIYVPWTHLLTESNQAWYDGYITSGLYESWQGTQVASNQFAINTHNAETLSNIVINYHTDVATNITFDSTISSQAVQIYPAFNTIFRAYFRERRIFITYQDVSNGTIYFASNESELPTNPQSIDLRVDSVTRTIPLQADDGSDQSLWSNITWPSEDGLRIRLPFESNIETTRIDDFTLNVGYDKYYLLKQANFGKYLQYNYQSKYPWASSDEFLLVISNEQGATVDLPVYIQYDPGYWINSVATINPTETNIILNSLQYRPYNTTTQPFSVSNVVDRYRIENDVQVQYTHEEEHISVYDPSSGYTSILSNETIVSTITPMFTFGDITYTCNLSNQHYTYDALASSWQETPLTGVTIQEVFPQASILAYASNIEYNSLLTTVTSNYYAYNCNIYVVERDDIYIEHRDSVQNRLLYTTSQVDVLRPSICNTVFWDTSIATTSSLYTRIQHVSAQSNIISREGFVPLTKHHVAFNGYSNIQFTHGGLTNYTVVSSNVGPVTQCTFAEIQQDKIWISCPHTGEVATSIRNVPIVATSGNAVFETIPSVIKSCSIDNNNAFSISEVIEACSIRFPGAFVPSMIHVYNVQNGYITTDGSNISTSCSWIDRNLLKYVPVPNRNQDTLQLFFSSSTASVTNVFNVPIYINFTPSPLGQVINMGVNTQSLKNTLSSNVFFYSYNTFPASSLQILVNGLNQSILTIKKNGLNISRFSVQDVIDGIVFIEFTAPVSQYTITFNVQSGFSTLFNTQSFTFYRLDHISHIPETLNLYEQALDISSIGENVTSYSNLLSDVPLNWYSSLMSGNNNPIPPSSIDINIFERPKHGILLNTDDPTKVVATCTLQDLISHKLRYISYDPTNIQEDIMGVRFALQNGSSSPILQLTIHQYYSHFAPYAINTAPLLGSARQLVPPKTSISMDESSYIWTTDCNMVVPFQNATPLVEDAVYETVWDLMPYTSNIPWTITTYASHDHLNDLPLNTAALSVDQADSISLASLSNIIPTSHQYALEMYILSHPKWGVVLQNSNGSEKTINKVYVADILNGSVLYQHMGVSHPLIDSFTVSFASSPYTLPVQTVHVSVTIRPIPTISVNTNKYIYYDTLAQSNIIHPFTSANLAFAGDGYAHVLQQSNMTLVNLQGSSITSFDTHQSNQYGYKVASNIFSQYPYLPSSFEFALNTHAEHYINPLYTYEPYKDVFVQKFTSYTNQHTDIQQILAHVDRYQAIAYDVEPTPALQSSLVNRIITMAIEMYPEASYSHPQYGLFLTDHFTFTLFSATGHLLRLTVYDRTWTLDVHNSSTVYTGVVPSSLTRNAWNTLKVVNFDPKNQLLLSVYWKYQSSEEVNLLQSIDVQPIAMEECVRYEFLYDIESPLMYIGSSNYVKQLASGIRTQFQLQNSYLAYRIRNFQVNVSTYTVDDNLEYDPDSHNIIIGKDINVQGVNNICMGNRFITSGNQSIIVGNNIGGGLGQTLTSVNDIFQSIILGNQSFRNSIVRDIICIGNDNFNNLSEEDAQKTRLFFAQKPIVIGNSVDASKIDYNINIGNVFLNTTIASKQIYLGQDGQCVAIGYTSNEGLSASKNKLYVQGNAQIDSLVSKQHIRSVISQNAVLPYLALSEQDENDNAIIAATSQSPLVCGVSQECFVRTDGLYDVLVTTRGKTKVWCKGYVQPGDLLVTDDFGCVVSRGADTTMHSFTFAKSLSGWDPMNPGASPSITTSNIVGYGDVALIHCIVLI